MITDDYNKPLLNPIETFSGNDNRVTVNGGYDGSDTILLETSRPVTSTDKTSIYLSSHTPGQLYSSELPTHVTNTFDTTTLIGTSNKKKVPNTKLPYITKPTSIKYGSTDKYVLIQTLSNDKNGISHKPGTISDNEINSIESIILMLNDTKTGPQYNTESKPQTTFDYASNSIPNKYGTTTANGNFFITTKLPSSTQSTKRPLYNVTYATTHNVQTSIFSPSSTPSSITTIFEKIPTLTYNGSPSTTKQPSTSYVYSTTIPKRPTTAALNGIKISSTSQVTRKPIKLTTSNVKKPVQKVTLRPISTSYVSGPTPARPSYSTTKKPAYIYSSSSSSKPTEAPLINKIGTSTPAPTVIVLGPYGIGSTENPSPTIHITPKPTANYVSSSTSWTANPDLIKFTPPKIPNTSAFIYNSPIITKRPGQNEPSIYTPGIGTVINNDFDDPGYYGITSTTAGPLIANIHQTVTSASIYAVVDDNGLVGVPTQSDDLYTSPNDLNNFPPVRNPNLNATGQVAGVTIEDYDISTPQFIEDELLNDKMGLLVNKIVESLKDNFHDLADIVENKTISKRPTVATTLNPQRPITTLPTKKPPQRLQTTTTTKRPSSSSPFGTKPTNRPNRRTTKKPPTTILITKRPITKVNYYLHVITK